MTDQNKFIELYKGFGIDCKVNGSSDGSKMIILGYDCIGINPNDDDQTFTESEKFTGYGGFHTQVIFDEKGKFVKQGFWE